MSTYAFGIDIGGTTVKIGLFETAGTLAKSWEIPTRKDLGGAMIGMGVKSKKTSAKWKEV